MATQDGAPIFANIPVYFYDFDDIAPDDIGTQVGSLAAAEQDARATLLMAAARDQHGATTVSVRDEAGQVLSIISLSVSIRRLDGSA